MRKTVLLNLLLNVLLTVIFVFLNTWALANQFEETFVSLAIGYGFAVIVGNSLFISSIKVA